MKKGNKFDLPKAANELPGPSQIHADGSALSPQVRRLPACLAAGNPPAPQALANAVRVVCSASKLANVAIFFLQIFGGLVLGCIKTKFCKKICV